MANQNDFVINVGTNIAQVMAQIEMATRKAQQLENMFRHAGGSSPFSATGGSSSRSNAAATAGLRAVEQATISAENRSTQRGRVRAKSEEDFARRHEEKLGRIKEEYAVRTDARIEQRRKLKAESEKVKRDKLLEVTPLTRARGKYAYELEKRGEPVIESAFRRALIWGAVSAAIYKSVEAAGQFLGVMIQMDKQVADLRKTLAGTDQDFSKLANSAINIARTYKAGTQDVLDAMEVFSKKYKTQGSLEEMSKAAMLFSNIAGVSVKDSAETLTSTITQFGLAVSDAAKITDDWASLAAANAVNIKDLGDAVGEVGVAAKTAGLSLEELNAIVATVASGTGMSGQEIGNAIKRILERSSVEDNAKELHKYGIHVYNAKGQLRDFGRILEEVNEGWAKKTTTEQKAIAVAFAGARQYNAFLAIMNGYKDTLKNVALQENNQGAAQKQNDRIAETLVKKSQALRTEFDKLARSLGSFIVPAFGFALDSMSSLTRAFTEGNTAAKILAGTLAGIAGIKMAGIASGFFFDKKFGVLDVFGQAGKAAVTGKGVGGGIRAGLGAMAGGIASSVGAAGGVGAVLTGFVALAGALAALTAVTIGLYKVWDALKYKGDEYMKEGDEKYRKTVNDTARTNSLAQEIRGVATERNTLTPKADIEDFVKNKSTGVLKDILADSPEIFKKSEIYFDKFGNALDVSIDKLFKLADALEENAERTIEAARQIEYSRTLMTGAQISSLMPDMIGMRKAFGGMSGGGPVHTQSALTPEMLKSDVDKLVKKLGIDYSSLSAETVLANPEFFPGYSDLAVRLAPVIAATGSLVKKEQEMLTPQLMEMMSEGNLRGANSKILERTAFTKSGLPMFMQPFVEFDYPKVPLKKSDSKGDPLDTKKGKDRQYERIDFELNKALVTSARNFKYLGPEVDTVTEGINAYETAIKDLANTTTKAAGPLEFAEMSKENSKANKEEKQSIQEVNDERERGLETILNYGDALQSVYKNLKAIQMMQNAIRDPLKGLFSNTLSSVQERISSKTEADAQRAYIQKKTERELFLQNRDGYSNTPKGRNALKALREELKAIDKQQKEINEKTDVWKNLLTDIGGRIIGSLGDKFATEIVNTLGNSIGEAFGGLGGFQLFGEKQDNVSALQANTEATNKNTAAQLKTEYNAEKYAPTQLDANGNPITGKGGKGANAITAGLVGAGAGAMFTKSQNKEGNVGAIGGAAGGAIGSIWGPIGGLVGGMLGGALGSLFDKPIEAEVPELDELEDSIETLTVTIEKNTKTINDVMENLINAPANFVLPIPKGILENSITAQSALATPLQAGGLITRGGLAYLHEGERVNSNGSGGGSLTISPNITIAGATANPQEIANQVISEINRVYSYQTQRQGRYVKRFN